jgi:hypothetical protein
MVFIRLCKMVLCMYFRNLASRKVIVLCHAGWPMDYQPGGLFRSNTASHRWCQSMVCDGTFCNLYMYGGLLCTHPSFLDQENVHVTDKQKVVFLCYVCTTTTIVYFFWFSSSSFANGWYFRMLRFHPKQRIYCKTINIQNIHRHQDDPWEDRDSDWQ